MPSKAPKTSKAFVAAASIVGTASATVIAAGPTPVGVAALAVGAVAGFAGLQITRDDMQAMKEGQ